MNHSDFFYCALPIGYALMCGILILIMLFQTKETIKIDRDRALKDMQLVDAIKVLIQRGTPALSEYVKQANENSTLRGLVTSNLQRVDELLAINNRLIGDCTGYRNLLKELDEAFDEARELFKNDPQVYDTFSRLINMIENA